MKEDFLWIRSCIMSCKNSLHTDGCHNLIYLFRQKYYNDPAHKEDYETLLTEIRNKEVSISVDA